MNIRKIIFYAVLALSIGWVMLVFEFAWLLIKFGGAEALILFIISVVICVVAVCISFWIYPIKFVRNPQKGLIIYLAIASIMLYPDLGSRVFSRYLVPSISNAELVQLTADKFIDDVTLVDSGYLARSFPSDTVPMIVSATNAFPRIKSPFVFIKARQIDSQNGAFVINTSSTYFGYLVSYSTVAGKNKNLSEGSKAISYWVFYGEFKWHALRNKKLSQLFKESKIRNVKRKE
jgi:hypothetical protein